MCLHRPNKPEMGSRYHKPPERSVSLKDRTALNTILRVTVAFMKTDPFVGLCRGSSHNIIFQL